MCGSLDSIGSSSGEPRAPEAGEWFLPHFAELVCRAHLDGGTDDTEAGRCARVFEAAVSAMANEQRTGRQHSPAPPPPASAGVIDTAVSSAPTVGGHPHSATPPGAVGTPFLKSDHADPNHTTHDDAGLQGHGKAAELCSCPSNHGTGPVGVTLISILLMFGIWFVYPRLEAPMRRTFGYERYDSMVAAAEHAASLFRQVASIAATRCLQVVEAIQHARVPASLTIEPSSRASELPRTDSELTPVATQNSTHDTVNPHPLVFRGSRELQKFRAVPVEQLSMDDDGL